VMKLPFGFSLRCSVSSQRWQYLGHLGEHWVPFSASYPQLIIILWSHDQKPRHDFRVCYRPRDTSGIHHCLRCFLNLHHVLAQLASSVRRMRPGCFWCFCCHHTVVQDQACRFQSHYVGYLRLHLAYPVV
jgi:hypothetical protein